MPTSGAATSEVVPPLRDRIRLVAQTHLLRTMQRVARLAPVQEKVVFASSRAADLGGNLLWIHEAVRHELPDARVVTLLRPLHARGSNLLSRGISYLRFMWRTARELATARLFIVDDYFFPLYVLPARHGTFAVQTWHASGPFKRIGYAVLDKGFGTNEWSVRYLPIHTNYAMALTGSRESARHYAAAFNMPVGHFVSSIGIPRTDAMFGTDRIARIGAEIRSRYKIPSGKRVVLYAPTFRGATVRSATTPQDLDLSALGARLGEAAVLLVREHPFVKDRLPIPDALRGFAIDVSDYPDINELMLVSDILVTDYSSAIFEYALLERPMAFFAPDLADYEEERSFFWDFRTGVPGPIFTESTALAEWLAAPVHDLAPVRAFRSRWIEIADGRSSERFVRQVVAPLLAGRAPEVGWVDGGSDSSAP